MTYVGERLKGIILRKSYTTKYFLTPYGWRVSQFITRIHACLFRPGFASLDENLGVHVPHPLRRALNEVNKKIDIMFEKSHLKRAA